MTRVVNLWNSLPNYVVDADSVLHFEKALDKFWQNVEFKFDYDTYTEHFLTTAYSRFLSERSPNQDLDIEDYTLACVQKTSSSNPQVKISVCDSDGLSLMYGR